MICSSVKETSMGRSSAKEAFAGRELILASASARRIELLRESGVKFRVLPAEVDESIVEGELPIDAALRLACSKAQRVSFEEPQSVVLAADTLVALPQQASAGLEASGAAGILGKPVSKDEAFSMLQKLQGQKHWVVTAFALMCEQLAFVKKSYQLSEVSFRPLSPEEIDAYVATGEPMDKAGAYGAQGIGRMIVSAINGSYTNVMGLPLAEVIKELSDMGLWTPQNLHCHA